MHELYTSSGGDSTEELRKSLYLACEESRSCWKESY